MNRLRFGLHKALSALLLVLGVSFITFLLMVHFGTDRTYESLGKNPSAAQIAEVRSALGHDRPLLLRYLDFVADLARLELGQSESNGEPVAGLLARTAPVTVALVLPGFVLGNLLGIGLGMAAAWNRERWIDRIITGASVAGMSLSFLVVIIALQVLLCTPFGLNLFPARGWAAHDLSSYLSHVTVPTLAMVFMTLGYNTRFYRAIMVEELTRDHVRTARAYGARPPEILATHVLKNSLGPILTRLLFSIPLLLVSGSLLLETYFGIPGIGRATFEAITNGDQQVLLAIVTVTAIAFVLVQWLVDFLYGLIDPRVRAP